MTGCERLTRSPARLAALCQLWRRAGAEVWVTLDGYSMGDAIPSGSRVCLRCDGRRPEVGEVAAFIQDGALVIHRLRSAAVRPDPDGMWLQFQGDGNPHPDAPVREEQVVGRVVAVLPPTRVQRWTRFVRRLWWRWSGARAASLPRGDQQAEVP